MKKFLLPIAALLSFLSFSSFAQNALLTITPTDILTNCQSGDVLTVTGGFQVGNPLTAFVFDDKNQNQSCPTTPPVGQPAYTPVNITSDQSVAKATIKVFDILASIGACSNGTATSKTPSKADLCLYVNNASIGRGFFQYDTSPNTLTGISVTPSNKRVIVTVTDPKASNANYSVKYEVCFGAEDFINPIAGTTKDCPPSKKDNTSTSIIVPNLDNGTRYFFTARVQGSANQWTSSVSATPVETYGFAKTYDGEPNSLSWSCTQTSASPATWMLFLLLGVFLKRRRLGSHSILLVLLLALPANADLGQINFGIIGSVYKPNLDSSTKSDGSTAKKFYGPMFEDKLVPLMGLEVDVHLLDDFGSLQIGLGAAYAYAGGKALLADGSHSNDSAGLHMLHLRPQLTYALDTWVDIVPLVPYVRGGIATVGYLFTYQDGLDKESTIQKPMGFVFGWEAAAGLMLALDWLEPSVSKAARANGVYEHIYLKAEAAYMPLDNFGKRGLNFSSAWPKQDFPLMLTFGLVFEFN